MTEQSQIESPLAELQTKIEADSEFLAERMNKWSQTPTINFIMFFQEDQASLLADTITAMSAQLYKGWNLTIFSPVPAPDAQLDEIPVINWQQVSEENRQQVVHNRLTQSDDLWFGYLRPGDQLEPSALILIVDYINTYPSWKFIYTDEDKFDDQGNIEEQLIKPDFDQAALEKDDFLGNSLFFSRYLFEGIPEFAGLLTTHKRLSLKVQEQAGDYSIGHIPVILYHSALENKLA